MAVVEDEAVRCGRLEGELEVEPGEGVVGEAAVPQVAAAVEGGHLEVDACLAEVAGEAEGTQADGRVVAAC